jgi:hypothetical protein
MSTLHLSDALLDDYVALFQQLTPKDQTVLLNALTESANKKFCLERVADPSGAEGARQVFGVWSGEENREDVEQMLRAIEENRMLEREVKI